MNPADRQPHIVSLDGLRGLAILSVVVVHVDGAFGGPDAKGFLAYPVATLFGSGWIGVDLFFVLSGFLITGILSDAKGSERFLVNFWARRALRIMPLYFGHLFFIVALSHVIPGRFSIQPFTSESLLAFVAYYYNFWVAFVAQSPLPHLHHFWSLAVEEHFYLLWPVVVMAFPTRTLLKICAAGMVLSFALRVGVVWSDLWIQAAYLTTPCRVDGLLAGAFVALGFRDPEVLAAIRRWAGTVATASGFVVAGIFLGQRHFFPFVDFRRGGGFPVDSSVTLTVGIAALSLLFAAALVRIVDARPGSPIRTFLESRWLVELGRYSYAMYVFHAFVIGIFSSIIYHLVPQAHSLPNVLLKLLMILLVLAATFGAAFISYHLFEKHFLRLKKFFNYRPAPDAARSRSAISNG